MEAMVTELSCNKLSQQISLKKVKDNWCVQKEDTKNLLNEKCDIITFKCKTYEEALSRYISLVECQARHIALISL